MKIDFQWIKGLGPVCLVNIRDRRYALCICHHIDDRSFKLFGLNRYLCARCTGILIGGIIGVFGRIMEVDMPLIISSIMIIPLIIDGMIQAHTSYRSTNNRRFITGLLCGVGIMFFIKGIKDMIIY